MVGKRRRGVDRSIDTARTSACATSESGRTPLTELPRQSTGAKSRWLRPPTGCEIVSRTRCDSFSESGSKGAQQSVLVDGIDLLILKTYLFHEVSGTARTPLQPRTLLAAPRTISGFPRITASKMRAALSG